MDKACLQINVCCRSSLPEHHACESVSPGLRSLQMQHSATEC